jgi:AmpD protein
VSPEFIDSHGVLTGALQIPSTNFDDRPEGTVVTLLVVHGISLPPGVFGGNAITAFFTNALDFAAHPYYATLRDLKVSSHFLVRRDGVLIQFVPCSKRAWHAGPSKWGGRERCNDFSIGVELEGTDDQSYADAQYLRLAELAVILRRRYPLVDMVGHSDISPSRKTDPGPAFDWARARALISRFQ